MFKKEIKMDYLEAFKNLKQELYYSPNQIPDIDKWHEIIEEALLRLKEIDQSSPSEALKCLKLIEDTIETKMGLGVVNAYRIKIIEKTLTKAQEQETIANENIKTLDFVKDAIKTLLIQTSKSLVLSKKYNVRVFHSNMLDEVHEFETLQAARDYAAKQKDFCLISMAIEEWFGED